MLCEKTITWQISIWPLLSTSSQPHWPYRPWVPPTYQLYCPHLGHGPSHISFMTFIPTHGLHDPMTTVLTHTPSTTSSSPTPVRSSVVGSEAQQLDVHVQDEQPLGHYSPPQGRLKRTRRVPLCGIGGWSQRKTQSRTQGMTSYVM